MGDAGAESGTDAGAEPGTGDGVEAGTDAGAESLESWTVATFNVVAFGLIGVLAAHLSGALADVLGGLGTLQGLLAFGYLWALVVVGTRWSLADAGLARAGRGETRALLLRGTVAGSLVGVAFLLGLALGGGLLAVLTGGIEPLSVALIALFGSVASAVVGGVVGLVCVLVDLGLARVTSLVLPPGANADG
jgi:hypothetical protein